MVYAKSAEENKDHKRLSRDNEKIQIANDKKSLGLLGAKLVHRCEKNVRQLGWSYTRTGYQEAKALGASS